MTPRQDRWFLVAMLGLLVALAVGLETARSTNTMAILAIIAVPLMANYFKTAQTGEKLDTAASLAEKAVSTAEDTNQRTQDIQHQLNGGLTARMEEIVDRKLNDFLPTLDSQVRASITHVQTQREEQFDERMRELVSKVLEERDVNCKVPPARRTRR